MIKKTRGRETIGMDYIKVILFLTISIGLTFATETVPDKQLNKRQSPDYVSHVYPIHYKVSLTMNIKFHFGQVQISICILFPTTILILNAQDLEINNVEAKSTSDRRIFETSSYSAEGQNFVIHFFDPLPLGNYTLSLEFKSLFYNIFFESQLRHASNGLLIMTRSARELFPCWDDSAFRATFDIAVTHSTKYTALSNAKWLRHYTIVSEKTWSLKFEITPMMTINQLVIVLLPYTVLESQELFPIIAWCKSNATSTLSFAQSVIDQVTRYLFWYTNIHPISKMDHVVIWDAPYSEARLGIIIHRESDVVYDKKKDPITVKFQVAHKVTSKVALQYFDGLVTPNSRHSWLNESFVLFFESYILNQVGVGPEMFLVVVEILQDLMRKDNDLMPSVLFEIDYTSDYILPYVYRKGSVLLRMLQHIMGEETFQSGVIKFLNKHKYELVTTDDLWSAMQTALNATSKPKVDIKTVMNTWILQKSFPVVIVMRDYETGETRVSQQPYNIFHTLLDAPYAESRLKSDPFKWWWIPVTWTTKSYPIFNETTPALWIGPENYKTINTKTKPDEWIIVNLQQAGYYRVHYDRTNWELIGNYLNNKNYTNIHILNRAQLIDDICDMFIKEHTEWSLFSFITSYLSQETNYIPWIPLLKCLDKLSVFFPLPESKKFQMHLAGFFDGILNEIGYEENPKNLEDGNLPRTARQDLAYYACFLGNPTCRNAAGDKLKKYLADPTTHQLLPWWKHWMFCFGLKTTNIKIWHQVLRLYTEKKDKTILNYLLCTEHISVVIDFLYAIVRNNTLIQKDDLPSVVGNVIRKQIHNDQIFSYILNELVLIKSINKDNLFNYIIQSLYSEERLTELADFIRIYTNDFRYEGRIEQRRQKIRALKRNFNSTFFGRKNVHNI